MVVRSKQILFGACLLVGVFVCLFAGLKPFTATIQPSAAPCCNNLRVISGAKEEWAATFYKGPKDVPTWDDLKAYLPDRWRNGKAICPDAGTYNLGKVGEPPTCSIGGARHSIP